MSSYRTAYNAKDEDDIEVFFSCYWYTVPTQCGGIMLSSVRFGAQKKNISSWDLGMFALTVSEVYDRIDKHFDKIIQRIRNPGFVFLSDNIRTYSYHEKPDEQWKGSSTAEFVKYLIARNKGVVVRGPFTENRNHEGSSVCTSWIWVPNLDQLVSASTSETFNLPEKVSNTYPSLQKFAREFQDVELIFKDEQKSRKQRPEVKKEEPKPEVPVSEVKAEAQMDYQIPQPILPPVRVWQGFDAYVAENPIPLQEAYNQLLKEAQQQAQVKAPRATRKTVREKKVGGSIPNRKRTATQELRARGLQRE